MNVLVLGGTVFLGRHLVERGHRVITFNRGDHGVDGDLPIRPITGDRTPPAELQRIPAGGWNAVIDPSSDRPDDVEAAARHLREAGRYVYISSVSADDLRQVTVDESARVITSVDGDPNAPTAEAFGWRKAASEERVDVRDLAGLIVTTIERDLGGIFHVTSPRDAIRMRDLVEACRDGVEPPPVVHWIAETFLVARGCAGWIDLPLWLPPATSSAGNLAAVGSRAVAAGLRLRPLAQTVRETREWFARSGRTELQAGLDLQRERELIHSWNAAISS